VTGKHGRALCRGEQVLGHRYVGINRSERQLGRHDVQTFLLEQRKTLALSC
jgi:hypothetical protein